MIQVQAEQVERIHALLSEIPGGVTKALTGVINRAVGTARTQVSRQIKRVYTVGDIRAHATVWTRRAEAQHQVGEIGYAGCKVPLYRFHTVERPARGGPVPVDLGGQWRMVTPGDAVSANVLRSGGARPLAGAFAATMASGHRGVFERETGEHDPIQEKMGPSVAQMAGNAVVMEAVERAAAKTIDETIDAEIHKILMGYGR